MSHILDQDKIFFLVLVFFWTWGYFGFLAPYLDLSLTELYTADEAFTSGTMGELTPIIEADGRIIGKGKAGDTTKKMQKHHLEYAYKNGTELPFNISK